MSEIQNTEETTSTNPTSSPQSNNTKWIVIGVIAIALIVAAQNLLSPARMSERMLEKMSGGEYEVEIDRNGSMEIKGEDGQNINISTGADVDLPENWPSSVPTISGAKITYSGSVNAGPGRQGLSVVYTTNQSVKEASEFYKNELESKGWKIEATVTTAEGLMLSASKGQDQSVAVYIGEANGMTTINLTAQVPE